MYTRMYKSAWHFVYLHLSFSVRSTVNYSTASILNVYLDLFLFVLNPNSDHNIYIYRYIYNLTLEYDSTTSSFSTSPSQLLHISHFLLLSLSLSTNLSFIFKFIPHLIDLPKFTSMAQGKLKLKAKAPARVTKKQKSVKAAAPRIIKAKKASAKHTAGITKIQLSQLVSSTEKLIASRVGHLELIKGSRRQIEAAEKEKAKKAAKKWSKLQILALTCCLHPCLLIWPDRTGAII